MTVISIDPEKPEPSLLNRLAQIITQGGIIIYPTETIYGLGGDGQNPEVINRIYRLKDRDRGKPLSLIVSSAAQARTLVTQITDEAEQLMAAFWPGPLTIVFQASPAVPAELTGTTGTVALRVPGIPFCRQLCQLAGCALIATSANVSGEGNNTRVETIPERVRAQVDAVVDGGTTPSTQPSTVIDMAGQPGRILRDGCLSRSRIQAVWKG